MLDGEMEGLKILYPFSMSRVEFVLSLNVLESLMIRMENEFSSNKIMTLMLQCSNDSIKLLVVGGVLLLGIVELLTKEGNGSLLLR